MTFFDLFCLALVAFFALWGLVRGLFRQIFGISGFVGGILLSRLFAASFAGAFAADLGLPLSIAAAAVGIAIFFVTEIVAKMLGTFLHNRMEGGFTGAVERFGGFLVGGAKGLLVAWAVASVIALVRPHLQHVEKDTPAARLDLAHSQAIAAANSVNLITALRQGADGRK